MFLVTNENMGLCLYIQRIFLCGGWLTKYIAYFFMWTSHSGKSSFWSPSMIWSVFRVEIHQVLESTLTRTFSMKNSARRENYDSRAWWISALILLPILVNVQMKQPQCCTIIQCKIELYVLFSVNICHQCKLALTSPV